MPQGWEGTASNDPANPRQRAGRNNRNSKMQTIQEKTHEEILAEITGADIENISPENYDLYGLPVFDVDGEEYAIGTDEECDRAAADNIRESVWAFNGWFIADHAPRGLTAEDIDALRGDKCEDVNDALTALIEAGDGMADFIDAAIAADGRGHFLSSYDGEEREDDKATHFVYRVN